MQIWGLTGPTGAGKGMVADIFREYGIPTINTDEVYHKLLIPPSACLVELVDRFGKEILSANGQLDRSALAEIVFNGSDKESARYDLNRITHRYVTAETHKILQKWQAEQIAIGVIDAPLLIEAKMNEECDLVIAVLADHSVRIKRVIERDGIPTEKAEARVKAQPKDDFYRHYANAVIENNGSEKELKQAVEQFLNSRGVRK